VRLFESQPRQHRPAVLVTWAATVVSVLVGVVTTVTRGFDPQLTILTATLIAIIWYTYFTYRAVAKTEPAQLFLTYEGHRGNRRLQFVVRNPTVSRSVRASLTMRLLRQGQAADVPAVLTAAPGTEVYLRPQGSFEVEVPVAPAVPVPDAAYGPMVQLGEPVPLPVSWTRGLPN